MSTPNRIFSIALVFGLLALVSCEKSEDNLPDNSLVSREMAGGEGTIFSTGANAYDFPLTNLDQTGIDKHFVGDGLFDQHFVTAPALQFGGVGPVFNQNSCSTCHIRNGRGTMPQFDGDPNSGFLIRLSMPGEGEHGGFVPVPGFGFQLQTKAVYGSEPEGSISKTEVDEIVTFLDGQTRTITKPEYHIENTYMSFPAGALTSPRVAPPIHGLGLIEAISEQDILAQEDPEDHDGDGISGKANWVWDVANNKMSLGRFGWKAGMPTAGQQAADAAHNDMGLTSWYFPVESSYGQSNGNVGLQDSLDLDAEILDILAFYFQTVGVPAARNLTDEAVIRGAKIFDSAECSKCHTTEYTTGSSPIAALSNQRIFPYTDLLLHDMGEGLADNRGEYLANGQEWRTPPLWGIGLAQIVNPNAEFLHDGRAATLEEAILWHGGEAENAKNIYTGLSQSDRDDLLKFLNSL